jgi:hypothetical protein
MDPTTGDLKFARFIPFDLDSFAYPTNLPRSQQEASFKTMNAGILNQTNVSNPVKFLIQLWYGTELDPTLPNPTFTGSDPNNPSVGVPTEWASVPPPLNGVSGAALYNAVTRTSCRSCHVTRDPNDTGVDIAWDTYDSFNTDGVFIHGLACTAPRLMPQAERTFARFWLSTAPNAPDTLANSGLQGFQMPNNNNCQ